MDKLWLLLIVAIIVAIVFWYFTRGYRGIPDTQRIDLSTDENRLFGSWFDSHLPAGIDVPPSLEELSEIGAQVIERLWDRKVDPALVVVGSNLDLEYRKLTGRGFETEVGPGLDNIYYLRDKIGRNGTLAIIHDPEIRRQLQRHSEPLDLHRIIAANLDLQAKEYLSAVLTYRWNLIATKFDLSDLVGVGGSYAYLRNFAVPLITPLEKSGRFRLNLLCSDLEFDALIKRWQQIPIPRVEIS